MTQIFDENGKVIPVTVIEAGPCTVVQKKTVEKDGYNAVQLGYGDVAEQEADQARAGPPQEGRRRPQEVPCASSSWTTAAELNVGDVIKADMFAEGDLVDVTGISKGHGYAGRHQALRLMHRLQESHGAGPVAPSRRFHGLQHRSLPYLQGQDRRRPDGRRAASPSRTSTSSRWTPSSIMLAVRGAIPGPKGGLVYLRTP